MWTMLKRWTMLAMGAVAGWGVVPAVAGAQWLSVTSPRGFPAGGDPTVTIQTGFEFGTGAPTGSR